MNGVAVADGGDRHAHIVLHPVHFQGDEALLRNERLIDVQIEQHLHLVQKPLAQNVPDGRLLVDHAVDAVANVLALRERVQMNVGGALRDRLRQDRDQRFRNLLDAADSGANDNPTPPGGLLPCQPGRRRARFPPVYGRRGSSDR
jgi:hypothetical protein